MTLLLRSHSDTRQLEEADSAGLVRKGSPFELLTHTASGTFVD